MRYFIVDAFTDQLFGGNPAGVVLLESERFPEEKLMLKIAAELRYSETAFIRRPSVVATRIDKEGDIYVGGTAAIVANGELCI